MVALHGFIIVMTCVALIFLIVSLVERWLRR